jgi:hypothetical protein
MSHKQKGNLMITIRWITVLILSVCLTGCSVLETYGIKPPVSGPTSTPIPVPMEAEPPSLTILHGHEALLVNKGSYCWTVDANVSGICVDVFLFPPVYASELYIPVIDDPLELVFDAPFPDTVTVTLYPENDQTADVPESKIEAVLDEDGMIRVTVSDDVSGNYTLVVFATWAQDTLPYGDAFYATPVRFAP